MTIQKITLPYTFGDSIERPIISLADSEIREDRVCNYAENLIQQIAVPSDHTRSIWRLKEIDPNTLASVSYDKTAKIFHNRASEWNVQTLIGHKREVMCLENAQGRLVTGSSDGLLKFWNIDTGELERSFGEPKGAIRGFYSLTFVDENTIATGACQKPIKFRGHWNHEIKLWDVVSGKKLTVLSGHSGGISTLINIKDSERLVSTSGDKTVRVWDIKNSTNMTILKGHTDYIYCAAEVKNLQRVATGGRDRHIRLWDLETGQWDMFLNSGRGVAHESTVYDLACFQNNLLISGSRDSQVRIWDSRTLSSVRSIETLFFVHAVSGLSSGDIVAAGPDINQKKPKEGSSCLIFKFV